MKRKSIEIVLFTAALAVAVGCGGSQKKGSGNTDLGGAPPPPSVEGVGKIDREVTREAKKDFGAAVAFYQAKAKAGWNNSACSQAASRFDDVAGDHPKLVEARFNTGLVYHECGMNKKAEAEYQRALKINPAHAPSLANLGEIYFAQGNEGAARRYWDQAVKADGKLAAPRNNLAWLILRKIRERPKGATFTDLENQALRQLQSALAVENDNVEAYVLLALLYMEGSERNKSRLTIASLLLDKAAKIDADFAPLWNARGLLLMRRANPANAVQMFGRAIQLDSDFVEARLNAGNIVLDFRKYDEAKAHFEAVLAKQSKNYEAMIGLGQAHRGLRDFDKAEESYKAATRLGPNRAEADFNLGILYMSFRRNETEDLRQAQSHSRSAIGYFRKAVTRPKGSASLKKDANENIRLLEKNVKQLDEAIRMQAQLKADEARAKREEAAGGSDGGGGDAPK